MAGQAPSLTAQTSTAARKIIDRLGSCRKRLAERARRDRQPRPTRGGAASRAADLAAGPASASRDGGGRGAVADHDMDGDVGGAAQQRVRQRAPAQPRPAARARAADDDLGDVLAPGIAQEFVRQVAGRRAAPSRRRAARRAACVSSMRRSAASSVSLVAGPLQRDRDPAGVEPVGEAARGPHDRLATGRPARRRPAGARRWARRPRWRSGADRRPSGRRPGRRCAAGRVRAAP